MSLISSSSLHTCGRLESSSRQFAASGRLAGLPLTFVSPDFPLSPRVGGGSIWHRVCLHFTSLYRALISKPGPAAPPSLCQESLSSSDQILMPRYSTRSLIHSQLILSVNYLLILRCAVRSPGGYIDQGSEYIIDFLSSHPASRTPLATHRPLQSGMCSFFASYPPILPLLSYFTPFFYISPFLFCLCVSFKSKCLSLCCFLQGGESVGGISIASVGRKGNWMNLAGDVRL